MDARKPNLEIQLITCVSGNLRPSFTIAPDLNTGTEYSNAKHQKSRKPDKQKSRKAENPPDNPPDKRVLSCFLNGVSRLFAVFFKQNPRFANSNDVSNHVTNDVSNNAPLFLTETTIVSGTHEAQTCLVQLFFENPNSLHNS